MNQSAYPHNTVKQWPQRLMLASPQTVEIISPAAVKHVGLCWIMGLFCL